MVPHSPFSILFSYYISVWFCNSIQVEFLTEFIWTTPVKSSVPKTVIKYNSSFYIAEIFRVHNCPTVCICVKVKSISQTNNSLVFRLSLVQYMYTSNLHAGFQSNVQHSSLLLYIAIVYILDCSRWFLFHTANTLKSSKLLSMFGHTSSTY